MSSALQKARNQGLSKQVTQKVYEHFRSNDLDKNTQLRWVWQLIQNAKDAPNDFGVTKIKQELNESDFISSHNGNAFTIKELHSVVAQYSTKDYENDESKKITGKNGTGFMTTFMIGKVATINSYLKIVEQDSDSDEDEQKEKQKIPEVQSKPDSQIVKQYSEKLLRNQKEKQNHPIYYKKFQIILDRSYIQRDKELKKKIQKAQQRLTRIVDEGQQESENLQKVPLDQLVQNKHKFEHHFRYLEKRDVDSYNSSFTYTLNEPNKIEIIEKALINLQKLMPYAILFNSNLHFYQFIDNRKQAKDASFAIEKVSLEEIKIKIDSKNVYLFKYKIKTRYNHFEKTFTSQQTKYILAYAIEVNKIVAAVPLTHHKGQWIVETITQDYCQVFKDFPLIGSSPIGWNAIINSVNFYPNERRSDLMLFNSDKSFENKVQQNKRQVLLAFQGIKQLYLFLALQFSSNGLENLLTFTYQNQMAKIFKELEKHLQKNMNEIINTRFIKTGSQDNVISNLKELIFIQFSENHSLPDLNYLNQKNLSMKINETFRFLYEDKYALHKDWYLSFYDKLHNLSPLLKEYFKKNKIVSFISFEDCLKKMQSNGYKSFKQTFCHNYIDKLSEIYGLIIQNKLPAKQFTIFLNDSNEFKNLSKDQLLVKNILPVVEELLDKMELDIRQKVIKPQFSSKFMEIDGQQQFDHKRASKLIIHKFRKWKKWQKNDNLLQINLQKLLLLFRLLLTLNELEQKNLSQSTIQKVKKFVKFQGAQPLKMHYELKQLAEISSLMKKDLITTFQSEFANYFEYLQIVGLNFNSFCQNNFRIVNQKEALQFLRELFEDETLGASLSQVQTKISFGKNFVSTNDIRRLSPTTEYPTEEDVQIFQLLRSYASVDFQIKQRLIMPIYPKQALNKIILNTYSDIFWKVKSGYQSLNDLNKYKVLKYIDSINGKYKHEGNRNNTIKEKYNAWNDKIQQRVSLLFNLKNNQKTYNTEPIKNFLFDLFDNDSVLKSSADNYGKRQRSKQNLQQTVRSIESNPNKKVKKE